MVARQTEMARFDVYANPDRAERKLIPYFLDVQNDHILNIETRVVVPLWSASMMPTRADDLNPEFTVAGQKVIMDTPSLGAAAAASLRRAVDNLGSQQLAIQNALDTLFGSY
jgi:toxin CcdB